MPNNINDIVTNHPWVGGALMAVFMTLLRVIYDQEETRFTRILLESLICGGLSLTAGSGLMAVGYGPGVFLFCGGAIGFMGSQTLRSLAYRVLNRKLEK